ncbi:MAG: ArsR family transcriptional regulator [Asgard group archaeon]|nr:ArsR family transcriptional regulator [Asgard group archaeon]
MIILNKNEKQEIADIIEQYGNELEEIVGTIGNKIRMVILSSLLQNEKDFSELKETVQLSKTALSHHLEKLVSVGLIHNISRGKYEITKDGQEMLDAIIFTFMSSLKKKEIESKKRADLIQKIYSGETSDAKQLDVHFIRLLPMKVVSFHAISESPENDAWKKLRTWAEPKGLLADSEQHPIYGFDNPNPIPGKKEYGYEFWLKVDNHFEAEDVVIKDIPESFYIVSRCIGKDPNKDIPECWDKLLKYIKAKNYKFAGSCGLEKVISHSETGTFALDIHIPLDESSVVKSDKKSGDD